MWTDLFFAVLRRQVPLARKRDDLLHDGPRRGRLLLRGRLYEAKHMGQIMVQTFSSGPIWLTLAFGWAAAAGFGSVGELGPA